MRTTMFMRLMRFMTPGTPGTLGRLGMLGTASFAALLLWGTVGSSRAEGRRHTLEDLRALAKSEAWSELVRHLEDVPPARRDKEWTALAEQGAIGAIRGLKDERDPLGGLVLADGLTRRHRFLRASKAFLKVRAEVGLQGFRVCFGRPRLLKTCAERLRPFVEADPSYELAADAAQLVMRTLHAYWAVPYYKLAHERGKHKACNLARLEQAVVAALSLPPADQLVKPAQELARDCFARLKDPIIDAVATGSARNACPVLRARGIDLLACRRSR